MYKEFYGLTTYPFAQAFHSGFFYPSENHENCLRHLLDSIAREHKLIVLTGEIGTGKTFLLNIMAAQLDTKTYTSLLVYPKLSFFEVTSYSTQEFHLEITEKSTLGLLIELKNSLLSHKMSDRNIALIIDEAQSLSFDVLDYLRFLANFERAGGKLLQVILAGQPKLEQMLKMPELVQLSQSCHLSPLNCGQTKGYIEKRLSVSGATRALFTPRAIEEISVYSTGIPRVINVLCDLALLFGYGDKKRQIDHTIMQRVRQELNLYALEEFVSHHPSQRRGAVVYGSRRTWSPSILYRAMPPSRRALMAGMVTLSLLGAAVAWRRPLSSQLRTYPATPVASSVASVSPHPVLREPPLFPQHSVPREPPLFPQHSVPREPSKRVQWKQTILSHQLPTGQLVMVPLPPLQRTPADAPVNVTLEASNRMPIWLKFDSEKLALSVMAPPTETGKTYHLTFRARTANSLESLLEITLTLIAQTKSSLAVPPNGP